MVANQLICLSMMSFYNVMRQRVDYIHNAIFVLFVSERDKDQTHEHILILTISIFELYCFKFETNKERCDNTS